jgi:hypothetical protein
LGSTTTCIPCSATWLSTNQRADKKSPRQNTSDPDRILSRSASDDFELINIRSPKPVKKPVENLCKPLLRMLIPAAGIFSTSEKTGFQYTSQLDFIRISL